MDLPAFFPVSEWLKIVYRTRMGHQQIAAGQLEKKMMKNILRVVKSNHGVIRD